MTESTTPAALLLDVLAELEERHPQSRDLTKQAAAHLAYILAGIGRVPA